MRLRLLKLTSQKCPGDIVNLSCGSYGLVQRDTEILCFPEMTSYGALAVIEPMRCVQADEGYSVLQGSSLEKHSKLSGSVLELNIYIYTKTSPLKVSSL